MHRIRVPNFPDIAIEYDEQDRAELGACPDCGEQTKRVWGYVYRSCIPTAAYFVEWNPAHPQRDAVFDLILGKWGDHAVADDRQTVSVAFRVLDTGPAFMVQDASARNIGSTPLTSRALNRDEVMGHPIAAEVFQICDSIYLADPRIDALRI